MKRVDRSKKKKKKARDSAGRRLKRSFIIFNKSLNSATKVLQWNYSLRGSGGRVRGGWLPTAQAASLSHSPGLRPRPPGPETCKLTPRASMTCSVRCKTKKWGVINKLTQRSARQMQSPHQAAAQHGLARASHSLPVPGGAGGD